ncbi:MAG: hypothetical protein ABI697_09445 [Devosia sp.]
MRAFRNLLLVGALALVLVPEAVSAGSLLGNLGGLLGGGSGNSSGSSSGSGSGNTGGNSGGLNLGGVASASSNSSNNGTSVNGSLLGGGGSSISTNLAGLLGDQGGVSVTLPNLGGLNGIITINDPNDPNPPNPPVGPNGRYYGSSGGGFLIPAGISSRLRMLLQILQDRDWLQLSDGRAVCLRSFGTASVGGWLPQRDWMLFQKVLPNYAPDIALFRQLLANCHSGGRNFDSAALTRVIGLDLRADGTPVVFML